MANEQEKLEARHQLLITLIHGTWGRGFFLPNRERHNRHPSWFEEGSPFLARLSAQLIDIAHKITPLLWSGENSIFVRDKTAHALAAEHADYPQASQLVIAHSHGGNIALRAFRYLQKCDTPQLLAPASANPLIVTLATPFIEVHQADFGRRPLFVRIALWIAGTCFLRLRGYVTFSPYCRLFLTPRFSSRGARFGSNWLGSRIIAPGVRGRMVVDFPPDAHFERE